MRRVQRFGFTAEFDPVAASLCEAFRCSRGAMSPRSALGCRGACTKRLISRPIPLSFWPDRR